MIYYMIRHKATQEFMPGLKRGRGYSYWNPAKLDTLDVFRPVKLTGTPRLFPSRRVAHMAIVQWNAMPNARMTIGRMSYFGEEYDGIDIKPDGRSKDDLEIVEVNIEVVEASALPQPQEINADLLEALKNAENYLDSSLSPCEPDCECVLHCVQAAIAKAENQLGGEASALTKEKEKE